jgi:hypothetical protein
MSKLPEWTGSFVDREHRCERCKWREATVIFDAAELCAICYSVLEKKLIEEGTPRKGAVTTRR